MNKTLSTFLALLATTTLLLAGSPVNHLTITTDTNNIVNGPPNFWDITFTDPKFTNDLSGWLVDWWPQGSGGGNIYLFYNTTNVVGITTTNLISAGVWGVGTGTNTSGISGGSGTTYTNNMTAAGLVTGGGIGTNTSQYALSSSLGALATLNTVNSNLFSGYLNWSQVAGVPSFFLNSQWNTFTNSATDFHLADYQLSSGLGALAFDSTVNSNLISGYLNWSQIQGAPAFITSANSNNFSGYLNYSQVVGTPNFLLVSSIPSTSAAYQPSNTFQVALPSNSAGYQPSNTFQIAGSYLTNGSSPTFINAIFSNPIIVGPLIITNNSAQGILITNPASGTFVLVSTNGTETNSMAVNFTGTAPTVSGATVLSGNTGTAGIYRSVTTDAAGRVASGSNPTTFSGYGISDTWANFISLVSGFPAYITGIANIALTNAPTAFEFGLSASNINIGQWSIFTNPANGTLFITNSTMASALTFTTNGIGTITGPLGDLTVYQGSTKVFHINNGNIGTTTGGSYGDISAVSPYFEMDSGAIQIQPRTVATDVVKFNTKFTFFKTNGSAPSAISGYGGIWYSNYSATQVTEWITTVNGTSFMGGPY